MLEERDQVMFQKTMKAWIVAKVAGVDKPYGIKYLTPSGKVKTTFTTEKQLTPLKNKDELREGDRLTRVLAPDTTLKVLLVEGDERGKVYVCKDLKGTYLVFVRPNQINEIIYEGVN